MRLAPLPTSCGPPSPRAWPAPAPAARSGGRDRQALPPPPRSGRLFGRFAGWSSGRFAGCSPGYSPGRLS